MIIGYDGGIHKGQLIRVLERWNQASPIVDQANHDRGQIGASCPRSDVPTGRSGGASGVVRGAPGSDRSAAGGTERRMIVCHGRM